jgi:inositol phosphorylceramide mannosyltransferase catalytic subunit
MKTLIAIFFLFQVLVAFEPVDFDLSMGRPMRFGYNGPEDKDWFVFWRFLYDNNKVLQPESAPRIPKIIHQIWLGSPVPERYAQWMQSWKLHHPDWQYQLWTDAEVKNIRLYNQELFDASCNYGQKSDILRYELLYRYGGLYIDIDFRCLKSFERLHHTYDFYLGILNTGTVDLGIGLIGSVPNHPILKKVIKNMHNVTFNTYQDILLLTGNVHFAKSFMQVAPWLSDRTIVFPASFFYPSPNTDRHLAQYKQDAAIKPESFAIHYWTCSWQKPEALVPGTINRY